MKIKRKITPKKRFSWHLKIHRKSPLLSQKEKDNTESHLDKQAKTFLRESDNLQ